MSSPVELNICWHHLAPRLNSQLKCHSCLVHLKSRWGGTSVPLTSCCVSAALCRGSPVCYEPARPGCARFVAGPSPSSPGAASSAEPSSASDHCDAPPTAKTHTEMCLWGWIYVFPETIPQRGSTQNRAFLLTSPLPSFIILSPAQRASWWWPPVSFVGCRACSNFASAAWLPSLHSRREFHVNAITLLTKTLLFHTVNNHLGVQARKLWTMCGNTILPAHLLQTDTLTRVTALLTNLSVSVQLGLLLTELNQNHLC